jgi:hypothetical protein
MERCLSLSALIFLFAGLCASQSCAQESQKIQTVVADGFGVDFQAAQQNAAQNALTNVVGSFIDATNLLEKRTEIREGIRNQTTNIKKDIKEYSQGTIQKIDIIEVGNEGALTRVTAKVSVRIDDFRAYIKKIAQGEVAVDQGLFAQAQVETKQRLNKNQLLLDNILKPLSEGAVIDFQVSAVEPFNTLNYKGGDRGLDKFLASYAPESIFKIHVYAVIRPEYLENMLKTLESTASAHEMTSSEGMDPCSSIRSKGNSMLDLGVLLFDNKKNNSMVEQYLISGAQKTMVDYMNSRVSNKLLISIIDSNGSSIQKDYASDVGGKSRAIILSSGRRMTKYEPSVSWEFIKAYNGCTYHMSERNFDIAIFVDPATLKDARKIIVQLSR